MADCARSVCRLVELAGGTARGFSPLSLAERERLAAMIVERGERPTARFFAVNPETLRRAVRGAALRTCTRGWLVLCLRSESEDAPEVNRD